MKQSGSGIYARGNRLWCCLGLLSVHTSYSVRTGREKQLKTGVPRSVPVHPELATALAEWKVSGWSATMGRPPTEGDLIVPSRLGKNRSVRHGLRRFHQDLGRLGRDTSAALPSGAPRCTDPPGRLHGPGDSGTFLGR